MLRGKVCRKILKVSKKIEENVSLTKPKPKPKPEKKRLKEFTTRVRHHDQSLQV